jgi:hypothetical protein
MNNYRKIETRLTVSNYPELLPPTHGPVLLEEQPAIASDLLPFDAEYSPAEHGMVTVDLSHLGDWAWVMVQNLSDSEHDAKIGFADGLGGPFDIHYVVLRPGEHCKVKHDATKVLYLDKVVPAASVRVRVLALDADVTDIPV